MPSARLRLGPDAGHRGGTIASGTQQRLTSTEQGANRLQCGAAGRTPVRATCPSTGVGGHLDRAAADVFMGRASGRLVVDHRVNYCAPGPDPGPTALTSAATAGASDRRRRGWPVGSRSVASAPAPPGCPRRENGGLWLKLNRVGLQSVMKYRQARSGIIGRNADESGDWYDDLVSAIGSRVGDVPVDEDCVQEAVIRYWQQLVDGQPIRSAPAWVKSVARNLARDESRRRHSESRALQRLGSERDMPIGWEAHPDADELRDRISRLPRRQREIVVLYYFGDLSVAEWGHGQGDAPPGPACARRRPPTGGLHYRFGGQRHELGALGYHGHSSA
jgi:RNA polymerase sigma factor (sigma-70 family)